MVVGLVIAAAASVALWVWLADFDRTLASIAVAFSWVAFAYLRFSSPRRPRLIKLTVEDLDELTGVEFEQWVIFVLDRAGFTTTATPSTGDFGIDIIAEYRGQRFGIQAKKRKGKNVGNAAVQQVNAGCDYYDCPVAVVVTQSKFTAAARAQAERLARPCLLIGRDEIGQVAQRLKAADQSTAADPKVGTHR